MKLENEADNGGQEQVSDKRYEPLFGQPSVQTGDRERRPIACQVFSYMTFSSPSNSLRFLSEQVGRGERVIALASSNKHAIDMISFTTSQHSSSHGIQNT